MAEHNQSRPVHIATAPNETIALMWKQVLEEEGIITMLKSADAGYAYGHNLLSEQYVFVREDQAEQAAEILEDFESEEE